MSNLDLKKIAEEFKANLEDRRVVVCAGTACVANGSLKVIDALQKEIEAAGIKVRVEANHHKCGGEKKDLYLSKSGCHGFCQQGPLVTIMPENILYVKVKPEDAKEIVEKTLKNGEIIDRLLFVEPGTGKHSKNADEITFYSKELLSNAAVM